MDSAGTDTVRSSVSFNLSNTLVAGGTGIEHLIYTNATGGSLTGNAGDNSLTGNSGNDTLNGQGGTDTLNGGGGNDVYIVDSATDRIVDSAGTDIVRSSASFDLSNTLVAGGTGIEHLIYTNATGGSLTGNAGDNSLTGNSGNDTLNGQGGTDTLNGGGGNDVYIIDSFTDRIVDSAGTDTVLSSLSFNLSNTLVAGGTGIEHLIYANATGGTLTGNARANSLIGSSGGDTLDGKAGVDTLDGGAGNDYYIVDSSIDWVVDSAGNDTILSHVNFDLTDFNFIENLTLAATLSASEGTGNSLANLITGNAFANMLDGGAGADSLYGGAGNDNLLGREGNDLLDGREEPNGTGFDFLQGGEGNDTYIVDSSNTESLNLETNSYDQIGEEEDGGTDTVLSSVSYRLSDFVEILALTGSSENLEGYGNVSDNTITGNSVSNTLYGEEGNDLLDGGAGADSFVGGEGNDTFIVDNTSDRIFENEDSGTDFVISSVDYNLESLAGNVENLTLSGNAVISGYGNGLNNIIVGNSRANTISGDAGNDSLVGGEGSDSIRGGLGIDSLFGGSGSDTLFVDSLDAIIDGGSELDWVLSSDTVSLTGGRFISIENISLSGGASLHATGNNLSNIIVGNRNDNSLDGGKGIDSLVGGAGNDTYFIDNTADRILELNAGGNDWVSASTSYLLSSYLENLVLSGVLNLNGTGNSLANSILGNSGKNSLIGGDGADSLIGGDEADSLIGGDGNDVYYVDNILNVVSETNSSSVTGGNDLVIARVSHTLANNVERLTLDGTDNLTGTGNSLANTISGNSVNNILDGGADNDSIFGGGGNDLLLGSDGADTLVGGGDNDFLDGGAGADSLIGGHGNDTYYVSDNTDWISDNAGTNEIYYKSGTTSLKINGANFTVLPGNTVVGGVTFNLYELPILIHGDDSILGDTDDILANSVAGGSGNDTILGYGGNDSITGNAGNDSLDGGNDNDTLVGGLGSDTLIGGAGNDSLAGGDGIDSLLGGAGTDTLFGGAGADYLDGGDSPDSLVGGAGNDTLIYRGTNDTIVGGLDTDPDTDLVISWINASLSGASFKDNIENLTLATTLSATLGVGNSIDNFITGNSFANSLSGAAGKDTIDGGAGNDSLLGGNDNDSLVGGAGNDSLLGEAGNDMLIGGLGTDTLIGGDGDDVYYIDALAQDVVVENSLSGGTDTIRTNGSLSLNSTTGTGLNYVLSNPYFLIENMVYDETFAGISGVGVSLTGNTRSNSIQGGIGNDTLDGGTSIVIDGGDTLNGSLGSDFYIVDSPYDWIIDNSLAGNVDTVLTHINFDPLSANDPFSVTRAKSFANLDTLSLSFAYLDNFIFADVVSAPIRGVGNALNNSFTGNSENNVILGLGGDDTILGGAGNDSLYGDRERAFLSFQATIPGGEGYNSLDGTYPYNPGDYDATGLGASASLFVGLDNGNDFLDGGDGDDFLSGNAGDDTLLGGTGDDALVGGAGIDSMIGGVGNDTFYVDEEEDVMRENSDEGSDWVFSTRNIYQLQDNIENIVIYGSNIQFAVGNGADNAIYVGQTLGDYSSVTLSGGDGNDKLVGSFSGLIADYAFNPDLVAELKDRDSDDYLDGGAGNDYIDGGRGDDTLEGGLGNDTIVVDSTYDSPNPVAGNFDKIWEFGFEGDPANGGTDWVVSSVDIDLKDIYTDQGLFSTQLEYVENGMFIENIELRSGNLSASGNWLNNFILGGIGNNTLSGELGSDTLVGGSGRDSLFGGDGGDSLVGANNVAGFTSLGEIDTLTGGAGVDQFILGDVNKRYYIGDGDNDYAHITDYASVETLVLKGEITDYRFDFNAQSQNIIPLALGAGLYVYYDKPDANGNLQTTDPEDDLVAFLAGATSFKVTLV